MQQQSTTKPDTSLYDYLGYAAGTELGKAVYKTASNLKEPVGSRNITNTRYKGTVILYRREFLDEYFRLKKESDIEPSLGDIQNYEL